MKIKPFEDVSMYFFNVTPDVDQYWKIFNHLIKLEKMEIRQHDGIVTDFWTNHTEWDQYVSSSINSCLDFVVKDINKKVYGWSTDNGTGIWTQITRESITHQLHNHSNTSENGTQWSFIWYIEVEEKLGHRGTLFYNKYDPKDEHIEKEYDMFEAEPKTGNLYFWPADLWHEQPPSFSYDKRIVLSGNLKIT
jgi:hypothetical protein